MERRERLLGYVAIAVGVMALIVALGGNSRAPQVTVQLFGDERPVAQAPAPPSEGPGAAQSQRPNAERAAGTEDQDRAWGYDRGDRWRSDGGDGHYGYRRHGGPFPGILAIGLLLLGARLFWGRGRWGGGWRRGGHWHPHGQTPPSNQGNVEGGAPPPQTGETRRF